MQDSGYTKSSVTSGIRLSGLISVLAADVANELGNPPAQAGVSISTRAEHSEPSAENRALSYGYMPQQQSRRPLCPEGTSLPNGH